MRTIPYGYCMKEGKIAINDQETSQVKSLFNNYLSGMSLTSTAEAAGISAVHGVIRRMLENLCYLGDEIYPALIGKADFDKAHALRLKRAEALGKNKLKHKILPSFPVATRFYMEKGDGKGRLPLDQAAYLYSLIREMKNE